jgi:hypothetical protein
MRKKQPKDYQMIGRWPYALGVWMLLLIVLGVFGWLLFAG